MLFKHHSSDVWPRSVPLQKDLLPVYLPDVLRIVFCVSLTLPKKTAAPNIYLLCHVDEGIYKVLVKLSLRLTS